MLSLIDPRAGFQRRAFLRIGSLALGGLSLPGLLSAAEARRLVRDKSVVFLFMHGGPSQFETFDPKMTAPAGIHSATGEISTSLPGITFGSTFPKLARLAHKLAIVRSYTTGDAIHNIKPIVSPASLKANLGSMFARVAGTTHPRTGMPTNAALFPQSVDPSTMPTAMNFGNFTDPGLLGAAYAPFVPGSSGQLQQAMRLSLSPERFSDRRQLLGQLDRLKRSVDAGGALVGMDRFQQQAFQTITSGVADAFDLSKEDPRVIDRYDTSRLIGPDAISRKWNNYNHYVDHGKSLGKLLLLARRLCERGCGFITITTNFVWDNHSDVNNAGVEEGMRYCGLPFDHAVSTFLEDVESRGLSDKILLVCSGEIGRTPRINQRGGRDHWGNLAPLLLAGGGLPMGKVIGQSTRDGGEPQTDPVTIQHLISTIMQTLLVTSEVRLERSLPSDLLRVLTEGEPIPGLA
jgi:hypothetical protein